jgi:spermidine synthase
VISILFHALFFISGATSLIYEVSWTRMLSLVFGSDVYSATITLSVFMGGLALGSLLAGSWATRCHRPLAVFGLIEMTIGLSALAVPMILNAFHDGSKFVYLSQDESAPWIFHGFRVLSSAVTLLTPTTLMGATLPFLARHFVQRPEQLGSATGTLYATNTFGALVGTLLAGFALLPWLGMLSTVELAAALNLISGAVAVFAGSSRNRRVQPIEARDQTTSTRLGIPPSRTRGTVLVAMALSGLAALALEIVWMRILVQSFSATVYAFTIMLACFLFGIAYGSFRAAGQADRALAPGKVLAKLLLYLALSVTLLTLLSQVAAPLSSALTWGLTQISHGSFGVASIAAQLIVASLLIAVPTMLLGATFPFAVRALAPEPSEHASAIGRSYAASTAGAIGGSILSGFLILPALGAKFSLLVIAGVFAAAGLLVLIVPGHATRSHALPRAPLAIWAAIGATILAAAIALPPQTIANYGLQTSTRPNVVFHREGISATVDLIRNDAGATIMMINGNVEADTSLRQRRHFVLKAYVPLLLHRAPKDIAVVGLGLGVTLRSTARYPGVERIRLIELSPDIVEAHRYLKTLSGNVLADPRGKLRIDDARNFMSLSDETFDLITADPIHPRITGTGLLYTREYYQIIKARLRPGGIVAQWMPMYNISPRSFDVALRTFVQVFPDTSFWYVRGHGLLVATDGPTVIDCTNLTGMFDKPLVMADFNSIEIASPAQLLGHLLMDRDHIADYLTRNTDRQINTDDNGYLEYQTPFEFLGRMDAIVPDVVQHAGWRADTILHGCSDQQQDDAAREFERRLSRIVPELREPPN